MAKKILNIATFGLAGALFGKSGKKKEAPAPAPAGPTIMPLPDDERVRLAKKRSIIAQMSRRGRDSTILVPGDRLGG